MLSDSASPASTAYCLADWCHLSADRAHTHAHQYANISWLSQMLSALPCRGCGTSSGAGPRIRPSRRRAHCWKGGALSSSRWHALLHLGFEKEDGHDGKHVSRNSICFGSLLYSSLLYSNTASQTKQVLCRLRAEVDRTCALTSNCLTGQPSAHQSNAPRAFTSA